MTRHWLEPRRCARSGPDASKHVGWRLTGWQLTTAWMCGGDHREPGAPLAEPDLALTAAGVCAPAPATPSRPGRVALSLPSRDLPDAREAGLQGPEGGLHAEGIPSLPIPRPHLLAAVGQQPPHLVAHRVTLHGEESVMLQQLHFGGSAGEGGTREGSQVATWENRYPAKVKWEATWVALAVTWAPTRGLGADAWDNCPAGSRGTPGSPLLEGKVVVTRRAPGGPLVAMNGLPAGGLQAEPKGKNRPLFGHSRWPSRTSASGSQS
jgi:hypothetical protein